MVEKPDAVGGSAGSVSWEVRPEWLAGRYWFRVYIAGMPRVMVRHQPYAIDAAEALAADEDKHRREFKMEW